MITTRFVAALVVLSHSSLLCAKETKVLKDIQIEDGLALNAPENVNVERGSPAGDFDILQFSVENERILKVYAGNAPGFPTENCKGQERETRVGEFKAKEIVCDLSKGPDGGYREILVDLTGKMRWPRFLHFMQPARSRAIGDAIVNSLELKPKKG
jgi:hypothetical protein